jgi:hypothetical protein
MADIIIADPKSDSLPKITLETSRTLLFAELNPSRSKEALADNRLDVAQCSSMEQVAEEFKPTLECTIQRSDGEDVPVRVDYHDAGGQMAKAFDPDQVILNTKDSDNERDLSPLMQQRVHSATLEATRAAMTKSKKFLEQADESRDSLAAEIERMEALLNSQHLRKF